MASLNKLAIRGIRSFDDKQIAVIEFFSPVTVIVGHNGSGKTTVIECLKYATTGDQPPNTRGGAFIHDPKMANEKEVKAQVKLRFHAANGQRMLAVRNLSVTMKKTGALQMKTLESILALADGNAEKGGKRAAISTKCAEMDTEIPYLLGVSKAVLENVIFCHQEDSYWPLSEPATLKKKFDDIFEATKYTKALDSIKALRKDRVAELKAEKERLESLAREKSHADKLRGRISDMNSLIATKEIQYDEAKREYDALVIANQKFYDSASRFREIFLQVETLEKEKKRAQEDLALARENLQEINGTDEELQGRLSNFDVHIQEQKRKRQTEETKLLDAEDELARARQAHLDAVNERGQLEAEAHSQEMLLAERERTIREISAKHEIKGFDHSPLERDKIVEFISRLTDLQKRQNVETEHLQNEKKSKAEAYNARSRQLHSEVATLKSQRESLRQRTTALQQSIHVIEQDIDSADALVSQQKGFQADIEEKDRRVKKLQADITDANYEEEITSRTQKSRKMEVEREELSAEIRNLSLQADSRAKLNLKRDQLKERTNEVNSIVNINTQKFRKLVGTSEIRPETMGRDLDRVIREKEDERKTIAKGHEKARDETTSLESSLKELQAQVVEKEQQMKRLDKDIKLNLQESQAESPEAAMVAAEGEISYRQVELAKSSGATTVYEHFLKEGKDKKRCPLCVRDMNTQALSVFEKNVNESIKKTDPAVIQSIRKELLDWENELKVLKGLTELATTRNNLKSKEIPALQQSIQEKKEKLPKAREAADEASKRMEQIDRDLKDLSSLKLQADAVQRAQDAIEKLNHDISEIEFQLRSTGSTKTVDDVQEELDKLQTTLRANEREKQGLITERERQQNSLRMQEKEHHDLEIKLQKLNNELQNKSALEKRMEEMKEEMAESTTRIKELDSKIAAAGDPLQQLEQEYSQTEHDLSSKIAAAQKASQNLNMNADKLEGLNKSIERYVRDKRARRLKECKERIEEMADDIKKLSDQVEKIRISISAIDKQINESGAFMANLRENIRVRRLVKEISETQTKIDSIDVEEAARAKRIFTEQYQVEKAKETEMQSTYARIEGELGSHRAQLKELEADLKEFKDINKRYRDQLIRVKMSDMANNDLEKYAKALDQAIMKYHSLKMEEVNDTMRHLWNKTYQGTDIDGIKISSDSEGGATKRSYNYRVVMTKDQVEMDMRGRCSAGQKMLASIIIRLALADSFGQNCGILALDEPTNALDTENIDALAASLVDIINERKKQANFQLIIITHDENFLRKLGQSDVMEYYWRVSRDTRQKSVIERHRFG